MIQLGSTQSKVMEIASTGILIFYIVVNAYSSAFSLKSIAFLVYKNEELHERLHKKLMEFLLPNRERSWVKCFGGAAGVEEYVNVFPELGEWGSSIQLLLAAKRYYYNFRPLKVVWEGKLVGRMVITNRD